MKEEKGTAVCAGRFSLSVPDGMQSGGGSQSIYRTNVKTVPVPAGGAKAYWDARLVEIRIKQASGQPGPRTVDLPSGVSAVWYRGNRAFPNLLTLETAKAVGNQLLVSDRQADAGKESVAEKLVTDIVNAFVPSTAHGFCVGGGAIAMEPSRNEQARLNIEHRSIPNFEIGLETRTVGEPDTRTFSSVEEEQEMAASHGGAITVLRNQPRQAAGLDGLEIWIAAKVPGETSTVRFTWHYPGTGGDATRPTVNLVGSAPLTNQAELEKAWETVLGSLKRVPAGSAGVR